MNYAFLEKKIGGVLVFIVVAGVLVSGAAFYFYWNMFGANLSEDHERWAQFGDFVGGTLGSLFALLALFALLLTLRLQSKELKNSSFELRNSALALKEQSKSLNIQNFENRLFSMLSLHSQIVSAMDIHRQKQLVASGRDCLKVFYERLQSEQESFERGDYNTNRLDGLNKCYEKFYVDNSHDLGHYFRFTYRILKFIDDSSVDNKKEYSGIFRAQLSNSELALLFYNGVSKRGDKFKQLAEQYSIFENIEPSSLLDCKKDCQLYDQRAFGDNQIITKSDSENQ